MQNLIIFFHPNFSDGGVERTNIILARGLIEAGYKVIFLTTTSTDHFKAEAKSYGIEFVELGPYRVSHLVFKLTSYFKSLVLADKKVFIIGCQYYVNIVLMFVSLLLFQKRKHFIFINSERNHPDEFRVRGNFISKLMPILIRCFYRFADLVLANAVDTANALQKIIKREVHCLYNPTINSRLQQMSLEPIPNKWNEKDRDPTLVAVGRLSHQKAFDVLIKAFVTVNQSIKSRLVIIGEGPLRQDLEKLIDEYALKGRIELMGFVKNPYQYIKACDLFILASRYEGLPNVLIESLYLGVPVVSTDCLSGPREILMDGQGGYLSPVDDVVALAENIIFALRNKKQTRDKLKLAQDHLYRFEENIVQKQFIDLIDSKQ